MLRRPVHLACWCSFLTPVLKSQVSPTVARSSVILLPLCHTWSPHPSQAGSNASLETGCSLEKQERLGGILHSLSIRRLRVQTANPFDPSPRVWNIHYMTLTPTGSVMEKGAQEPQF